MRPSLQSHFQAEHEELNGLFAAHQERVLLRDAGAALETLRAFRARIAAHIAKEDGELIPIYTERVGEIEGGRPDQFLAEHRQIERTLDRLLTETERLTHEAMTPQDAIALLDRECQFKHLMDHHERREETFLFPKLDELLSAEEKERIWRRFDELERS